ncbi:MULTISPECIES: hypothetical protein [unclassified Brevibacterium]|uniref:hypothetical protein n=1 Tax=unclassified Brevibacterium TaxID=2614124 RepID=UPI00143D7238|nr:hypothetical protein [Brevibacterium sp. S22]
MFGLPTATVVIIFGIPAIWVIYTLVFVFLSRGWKAEDVAEDQALANDADGRGGGAASVKGNGGAA